MDKRIIEKTIEEIKAKLEKFNAPTEDVEEIVIKVSQTPNMKEHALRGWAETMYFNKHPEIAEKVHVRWHSTR